MKIEVTLSDPDALQVFVFKAARESVRMAENISEDEKEQLAESRAEEAKEIIEKHWMDYGEYISVEFDTEAKTARVIERNA